MKKKILASVICAAMALTVSTSTAFADMVVPGDFNNDGKFNMADLTDAIKAYADKVTLDSRAMTIVDVNKDGMFTISDLQGLITQYTNRGKTYDKAFWDSMEETSGSDFSYKIVLEGITLTGYNGTATDVKIPKMIDGEPVVGLGDGPLHFSDYNSKRIKNIYIPEGIKLRGGSLCLLNSLETAYFAGNDEDLRNGTFANDFHTLKSVIFEKDITTIANGAFEYCDKLEKVVLPDTVTTIGSNAFRDCSSLTSVNLPDGLKQLGSGAFENCSKLENLNINVNDRDLILTGTPVFGTPWLKNQEKKNPLVTIGKYVIDGQTCTGDVEIPEGIEIVCGSAFANNGNITSVTFPSTLTRLARYGISNCQKLRTITFNSQAEIVDWGVQNCVRLTTVNQNGGKIKHNSLTFYNCPNIKW